MITEKIKAPTSTEAVSPKKIKDKIKVCRWTGWHQLKSFAFKQLEVFKG
jgi:hypothetical protein